MRRFILLNIVILLQFISCSLPVETNLSDKDKTNLVAGMWHGYFDIGKKDNPIKIPFNFEVINDKIIIHNGDERIEVTKFTIKNDSIYIKMPVFGSEFKLTLNNNTLKGTWHNYNKLDYQLPFTALANNDSRFEKTVTRSSFKLAKRWKVTFSPGSDNAYPAIGLFEVNVDGKATGTFLTETGDYRYLEGIYDGQNLKLSCFDGAHAFLFKAKLMDDGNLIGDFWSGKHWHETWEASPNDDFELTDMDKLTYLKEGYDKFSFSFQNSNGDFISLEDEQFKGKATIVQITGSWCPNCMDETRFLVEAYNKYHSRGLEIIAIDYEIINSMEQFKESEKRLKEHLNVNYTMLFGGAANKSEAIKTLPMLNHIMSYPTTIFLDKAGNVRKIHTGFSGPGTGDLYHNYVEKTNELIEMLITE
ncbi:MAG: TlpA family protein disulfide reductase [Saprospiraceae bacterium]|nr:TlpA family protein disulfide reductase [Saprospiraceae bacterium]